MLTIPNTPTTNARIKIEAVGNIFFDISNTNFTITAGTGCGAPSGLTSSAITTTDATVSWTPISGAVNYDVDYKLTSSGTWTNAATATTATSVNLTGLTAASVYDWRVRTNCSSGPSAYTAAQFTTAGTAPSCGTVAGLASSSISSSSATVNWTALSGANNYDVDYKANSSTTWISAAAGTTSASTTISGLAASTLYDWRVRANCSGASGNYSAAQFTTSAVTTGCQSSLDNTTNGTTSGAATIPFNTNVTGLISPSGDKDNYKFVITTPGSITVTLTNLPADYDLKLLNSAGTQVAISQRNNRSNETINYTAAAGTYYAQVYGYRGANSATSCYTLKVQLGTATRSSAADINNVISIYPNPVHNQLKISIGSYKETVSAAITDMYGRRIMNKTFTGASTINTNALAAGVYMITIRDKNGVIIKQEKIVKE